ncbi:uncharacterized protein [Spinacia oleracea]|uniref:DDE Tnp4 domain-containing protein n=1 Tax=Spinacia oleracea TaxID=3562 RepID=A0A9R0JLH4_SPIOL|nr:uncharacterized protein LOC110778782 [Spinacia oleracea]
MDNDEDIELAMAVVGFIIVVVGAWYGQRYRINEITWNECDRAQRRATWMNTLRTDRICREKFRLDICRFEKLCHVLQTKGGLVTTKCHGERNSGFIPSYTWHDLKNRTMQALYARSGETVSRQFHVVLASMLKLGKYYIKQIDHNTNYADDNKWKWFEGVVGALDGTHIKMTVSVEDRRPRYRDRKGDLSTNVLATCDPNIRFTYVLPGWEGSTSDPRVLRDALRRPNGLKVPRSFSNAEGFLAPYKGTRYHLNLWRGNTPTYYKELFNLRHSSARNTIERAFGLLKKRWSILRDASFFPKKIQIRIMNACFILHNFLREENMEETSLMQEVEEDLLNMEAIDEEDEEDDYILTARSTNEWNEFRDDLAKNMFDEYLERRAQLI